MPLDLAGGPQQGGRAAPGGLIAAGTTYLSRREGIAPVLAHVPSFGRNLRGSPDILAYPLPKACQCRVLVRFAVLKACKSTVANPVSSLLGVLCVVSVQAIVGTAAVGCGYRLAAVRLSRAAASRRQA